MTSRCLGTSKKKTCFRILLLNPHIITSSISEFKRKLNLNDVNKAPIKKRLTEVNKSTLATINLLYIASFCFETRTSFAHLTKANLKITSDKFQNNLEKKTLKLWLWINIVDIHYPVQACLKGWSCPACLYVQLAKLNPALKCLWPIIL